MTQFDPAAIVPPAPGPDTDPADKLSAEQIAGLLELLAARNRPAANTDDAAVVSSPATGASVPEPVSSVPPPPVGSVVVQSMTPPGQEHPIDRYGIVVAVDDAQNTAAVSWFLAEPTSVTGDTITKVG